MTRPPAADPRPADPASATPPDGPTQDGENLDSPTPDGGTHDSGTHDSPTHDSGTHDSPTHDSGTHDSGTQVSPARDSRTPHQSDRTGEGNRTTSGSATRGGAAVEDGVTPGNATSPVARRVELVVAAATWLVVALGIALRVRQWLANRSFWADEAGLWLAVLGRDFGGLTKPLPSGQAAPIGWLWAQHAVSAVFGTGERSVRLLPLLFGCGALVLTAVLARRVLGGPAAFVATFLVAWSPLLVYYSNEYKQYSADVFCSLLLLVVGVVLAERAELRPRAAAVLGGTAAAAVWFSHAAVLTGAGVFGALGLLALFARQWRRLLLLVAAAVPLLLSVAVDYAVALSKTVDNDTLQSFWAFGFPPQPLTLDGFVDWVGSSLPRLMDRPLGLQHPALLLTLLGAGTLALAVRRSGRRALLVLATPLLVLLVAAILHVYPASDRLALFAVPTVLLVAAAPVSLLRRWPSRPVTVLAAVLAVAAVAGAAVLTTPNVEQAATYAADPLQREETRPVIAYIGAHLQPGDVVLFDTFSLPVSVYGQRYGVDPDRVRVVGAPRKGCVRGGAEKTLSQRYTRVWLAWGHTFTGLPVFNRDGYRAHLRTIGRRVDTVRAVGAGADLYDLTRPAEDPQGRSRLLRTAGATCLYVRGL